MAREARTCDVAALERMRDGNAMVSTPNREVEFQGLADELAEMLTEKNRKYGDSALNPVRVFSEADPLEQLRVRIDDKLSRIRRGAADDDEDPLMDLIGYLMLYVIARRTEA